ncbi:MAG: family 20 glycosylhydrolase [Verrucomicrobia bacterium]|nr:family 20 glycosylhydrolase [Verrucomicrobiota bacterium]
MGDTIIALGPGSPITVPEGTSDWERQALGELAQHGSGITPLRVRHDADLVAEGYRLEVSPEAVELSAGDARGRRYGIERLRQMTANGLVKTGRIVDSPSLGMRGYHLNLSLSTIGFNEGMRLLDSMANWRLNTVLVEYNARYPYKKHHAMSAPDALQREQVCELVSHAQALNIEVIPLHQCLGHVEYILNHDAYAHLREEDEHRDQWCPLKKESLALFKECVDDFVELHPGIRYFHMGGDEARRLGTCPKCAKETEAHGKGRLYVDFVTKAAEYVLSLGLTPIVWDDMLCTHSEVIEQMPREIVIMYWDYWTVNDPCAIFVARPENGLGVVTDRRWLGPWRAELGEVEQRMIAHFAKPMDFQTELSPAFCAKFGKYLGNQFPKRIRAFPYIEFYQDLGFKVIGAAAGGSNTSAWHGLPDWPRYGDNIRVFCRRLHEAGSLGVVTTAWYNFPPEAMLPALMYTGQFAWNVAITGECCAKL